MRIEYDTITDRGLNPQRPLNEDRVAAFPERGVFLVCDGVGGQNAGEVASQTVVDLASKLLERPRPQGSARQLALEIIGQSNARIHHEATTIPAHAGMATTIAMVIVRGKKVTVAHVGDSRVYKLHNGTLHSLTVDHSFLQDAVRSGHFSASEIPSSFRNIISRAIGSEPTVEAEISEDEVSPGDWLLLCSDGVTRHLEDAEIAQLLEESGTPSNACAAIRRECFARGAEDNLSALVLKILDRDDDGEKTAATVRRRKKTGTLGAPATRFEVPTQPLSQDTIPADQEVHPAIRELRRGAGRGWSWSKAIFLAACTVFLVAGGYYVGRWSQRPVPTPSDTAPPPISECDREIAKAKSFSSPASKPLLDGLLAYCAGRYREAVESFSVATQREPNNGERYYWLSRAEADAGESRQAITDLEKAKALGTRREDVEARLAQLKKLSP